MRQFLIKILSIKLFCGKRIHALTCNSWSLVTPNVQSAAIKLGPKRKRRRDKPEKASGPMMNDTVFKKYHNR